MSAPINPPKAVAFWENLLRGRMLSHAFEFAGDPTALCGLEAARSWLVWQPHQAVDVKCRKCAAIVSRREAIRESMDRVRNGG